MRRARLKVHASGIDEQIDRLRYARERSRIRAAYFARLSDHPERTIRRWCATGYLPATRRGPRVWWVDLHPLECTAEVRALLEIGRAHV